MKRSRFLTLSALYLATHGAVADDTAQKSAEPLTRASSSSPDVPATTRLAGEFAALVGSETNAERLIDGLHNGSPVSLPAAPLIEGKVAEEIRIQPPRPLTLPEVHAALSLAQAQLKAKGIDNPVPADYLRSALVGGPLPNAQGDMTRVIGILPLRQRGMKWEQIARALHVVLPAPWSGVQTRNSASERKS